MQLPGHAVDSRRGLRQRAARTGAGALELSPTSVDALAGAVQVDLANRKPGEAIKRIEQRLSDGRVTPDVLILAARTYGAAGKSAMAERMLLQAIKSDPNRLEAYSMLGQIYVQQNRLAAAQREFDAVIAREPGSVPAQTMGAVIAHAQNNRKDAEERYRKVLDLDGSAAVAANNLAWMYTEDGGNLDVALQLAQNAVKKDPKSPPFNDTLGWVYYKKGMLDQAVEPLKQSVAGDASNAAYAYHLGVVYAAAGDPVNARQALQRALRLEKTFDGADQARQLLASMQD